MKYRSLTSLTNKILSRVEGPIDGLWRHNPRRPWVCTACGAATALSPKIATGGVRRWARCPHCKAAERHRLAAVVFDEHIEPVFAGRSPRILHMAPEPIVADRLRRLGGGYETGDLFAPDMDHQIDLTDLPFADGSFDILWASHVLAVIRDDRRAIAEIRRVLAPGGLAVLPVPILQEKTNDYPESVAGECDNWHGPGWDYFDRYLEVFDRVEVIDSAAAPSSAQTYVYEDRSRWPSRSYPYRSPSAGLMHRDAIPLCWAE